MEKNSTKSFEGLIMWQEAHKVTLLVYELS